MKFYDTILVGIMACLVTGAGVGALTQVPLNVGISSGSVLSLGLMYQGMFRNAPVPVTGERR